MGRTQPSVGQPPAAFRKAARAKKAKVTLNQLIPSLLPTHPRARRGVDTAELIIEPKPMTKQLVSSNRVAGDSSYKDSFPRIRLQVADTLTAAHSLVVEKSVPDRPLDLSNKETRVAILNMASPLTPGGGFINGASSQEESLCMRTTLLPSLKDEYYRLPELGAVYTPDVLVFRDEDSSEVQEKKDRWFVDCISAAMLRNPETDRDETSGFSYYVHEKDRQLILEKMKVVLRVCQMKGIKKIVLGAWGCGAYGNPVAEVAKAWRKALIPRNDSKGKKKSNKETWAGIEDVVFAIKDPGMADAFEEAFGKGIERDELDEVSDAEENELDVGETNRVELQARISELKQRIEATSNLQLKKGLDLILAGLISQLPPGAEEDSSGNEEDGEEVDDEDEDGNDQI
ncbi:TIGR02452 family protein [Colletotrichum tofieldiae]|uniref:TIGR02452 family protein n=1 Tax=Colletotrichum tofieldiae TaxID=708197 RepID=A0A166T1Y0_9PEZI|nr:TIGR02452 family protein [Colletotrichum tofieldiae]